MTYPALKKRFFQFCKKRWSLILIVALTFTFFYPVIIKNKIPLPTDALVGAHMPWSEEKWEGYPAGVPIKNQEITDAISQFYPWRTLVGEFWREGKVPHWNWYMFNGTPFLATLHSAALYPLNILYLFLNNETSWSMLLFLQILLAGTFMHLFLKDLGLKNFASFIGSVAFAFSGYMIAWLEFATGGHAGLWLPLLLLLERKMLGHLSLRQASLTSLVFFMIFTAGDFQVPMYISVTYFIYGVYLTLVENKQAKLSVKRITLLCLTFLAGLLLSAVQLFPTIELFLQSVRQSDPYIKEYFYGIMDWEKITNFIWPDFFGNVVTRNYWGKYGFHEYISYIGIIPLIFVLYSAITKKMWNEKFFWFLLIIGLLFLFPTPFAFIPYKLNIPALSTSSASRIIFLVDFCLAVLSAYGVNKWYKSRDIKLIAVSFILLALSIVIGIIILINTGLFGGGSRVEDLLLTNLSVAVRNMIPQTAVIFALFCSTLLYSILKAKSKNTKVQFTSYYGVVVFIVALNIFDILRYAWKNTPFSQKEFLFPKTETINFLVENVSEYRIAGGIPTNLFMPYKLFSAEGYDPLYPERNSRWYSIIDWGNLENLGGRYGLIHYFNSNVINYAGVKYVVDYKKNPDGQISDKGNYYDGITASRFKEVFKDGRISVFENQNTLPYVWLGNNLRIGASTFEMIQEMNKSREPTIFLDVKPDGELGRDKPNYNISNLKKNYNEIELNVTSRQNAMLFLAESFYPGWSAFVDGKQTNIYRANYLFQSIFIPSGNHKVVFRYVSKAYIIGFGSCIITLILLVCLNLYEATKIKIGSRITQSSSSKLV